MNLPVKYQPNSPHLASKPRQFIHSLRQVFNKLYLRNDSAASVNSECHDLGYACSSLPEITLHQYLHPALPSYLLLGAIQSVGFIH